MPPHKQGSRVAPVGSPWSLPVCGSTRGSLATRSPPSKPLPAAPPRSSPKRLNWGHPAQNTEALNAT